MVEYGEKVKKIREEKGMTQQTMADHLYVTRQAVSRWECGARYPDLLTAKKISRILDVSLDELPSGEEIREKVEKEPILAKPVENIFQTMLYSAAAIIYLLLCLFSLYAYLSIDKVPSNSPAAKITVLDITSDLIRMVHFAAAVLGLVMSMRNRLTAKITGYIMSVPYLLASLSFLVTYVNMRIKHNGHMDFMGWFTDFMIPLLFALIVYTSDFDRETVNRYVEEYGYEVQFVKVSREEVQDTVEQIFGSPLSAQVEEELSRGPSVIHEDGFYYISISDSPDYKYEYVYDTDTDILKEVELLEGLNDEVNYDSRVYLYLIPAENERGFIITGKDRLPISQDTESGMIREQSFDVEFNPHGQVTFAAYAPNTELNPSEDVVFKLIQDGQIIYSFGEYDIGRDKDIWKFQNVAAVAFPDLNGDGYTDVVTLSNYKSAYSESTISETRIYTGREGRYFLEETFLEEAYNNSHDQKTITDVENFVSRPEYQDYYVRTAIYGRWKVTEHIPPTGISALSEEEVGSYENTRLEYGMYWYKQGSGDPNTVDHYRKETITSSEFEEDFRTSVSAMGISATEFDYFELEGVQDSASSFGQNFYQIDTDNALVYYEGVFFRAVRE